MDLNIGGAWNKNGKGFYFVTTESNFEVKIKPYCMIYCLILIPYFIFKLLYSG